MALSRVKVWIAGEVLTASDLNSEFNNILNNAVSLISPLTNGLDIDGQTLTLDAAGVTTVVSSASQAWQFTPGAKSGTPSTTGGIQNWVASTYTDSATAGSGTATAWVGHAFQRPTLAATNSSVTTTAAATVYIANAPTAGTNQTLTNAYALWVDDGNVRLDGDLSVAGAFSATGTSTLGVVNASGAITATSTVTVRSTDAGAAVGPTITLDRNSASPAASDVIGSIDYTGRDSGGNTTTYGRAQVEIDDPNDGSEDSRFAIQTMVAGTLATRGYFKNGLVLGSATGGDQGQGTINCESIYVNGALSTPGITKVASGSGSSITTIDIVMTSFTSYKNKLLLIRAIPTTDGREFYMRVSTDGGSTFDSAAGNYSYSFTGDGSSGGALTQRSNSATEIRMTASTPQVGNAATEGTDIAIWMFNTTNTALWPRFKYFGTYIDESGTPQLVQFEGGGIRRTAQDTDAVQIGVTSTNGPGAYTYELYAWN